MSTVTRDYWRDVELKYFSPIMEYGDVDTTYKCAV